ncbi:MAG: hypothetical protein M3320_09020 [Actinomycetota bacterium]|nr:hypothetical protein [Actinomycetota bacterium]MDQ5808803.1 hypothetical protein [Actinomycetota bacterium]
MKTSEFFVLARSTLARVDGVDEVHIDLAGEGDSDVVVLAPDELDSDYAGPHFGLVSTSFELTLPHERQVELAGRSGWVGRAERFRVHLTYGWLTPVSCIEVLDVVDSDPFGETRFVGQHMEAEFRRLATGLDYCRLPTGTVHADIWLRPGSELAGHEFIVVDHSRPAYDRYVIEFDASLMGSDEAVEQFVRGAVNGEVDICHQAGDARLQAQRKWAAASDAVDALRETRSASSLRGRVRSLVSSGNLINEAALLIADTAAFAESSRADLARQVRQMYRSGGDTYLQPTVEDALNDLPEFPVDRLSEIVRLYETQRITNREMAAVVTSSLGGGIVGALLAG